VPYPRQLVAEFLPRRPGFAPRAVHVGFVVYKVALGQVFPESFGFILSISFHRCSIFTHVSSGGWTVDPLAAAVPKRQSHPIATATTTIIIIIIMK
jgi:hypothetical protein